MGIKRAIRDIVFVAIAINMLKMGDLKLAIYALIILFFTIYFYVGSKF